jgi:hypothetical protein
MKGENMDMDAEDKLFLLQITGPNGDVVAEAPLRIYDREMAMAMFLDSFAKDGHTFGGKLLSGLLLATGPQADTVSGVCIAIRSDSPHAPKIIVPNGMPPRGGY